MDVCIPFHVGQGAKVHAKCVDAIQICIAVRSAKAHCCPIALVAYAGAGFLLNITGLAFAFISFHDVSPEVQCEAGADPDKVEATMACEQRLFRREGFLRSAPLGEAPDARVQTKG